MLIAAAVTAYWVAWILVVHATVGVRNFVFFDSRHRTPRRGPSLKWSVGVAFGVLAGAGYGYVVGTSADPAIYLIGLHAVATIYTAWAIPFVRRRLRGS